MTDYITQVYIYTKKASTISSIIIGVIFIVLPKKKLDTNQFVFRKSNFNGKLLLC